MFLLLSRKSAAGLLAAALLLTEGYLLFKVKEQRRESKLILPIPVAKPLQTHRLNTIKKFVLGAKTTDNYPPNKYFPPDWRPMDGEIPRKVCLFLHRRRKKSERSCISAQAYLVFDKTKNKILYARNQIEELPIASLVKIMTAVVALENAQQDTRFIVPEEALVGESVMGLSAGESVRVEDLLYGMLLASGNDAAETLAYGVGGRLGGGGINNRAVFIQAMNKKAEELRLFDTFFVNPTGLDGETVKQSSFSTALDLLALTNYALEQKQLRKIVGTKEWVVPYTKNKHKAFRLYNKLGLSETYPAIKGVKPGTTDFAGNTLVSYGELYGQEYILVMLNSPHIRDETQAIYRFLYGSKH